MEISIQYKMKNKIFLILLVLLSNFCLGQKTFSIWPGIAPGSEEWHWQEQTDSIGIPNDLLVYNVVQPSLIYFPADPSLANGSSVIICPGGSFCYLHVDTEGSEVAKWLNKKGVSAFVLKYRLVHSETNHPMAERIAKSKDTARFNELVRPLAPLAIKDAKQAIVYLRKHATDFGVSPNQIGIMGFSAGGALAVASAVDYTNENRPEFVASIYAYVPSFLLKTLQKDEPPIFKCAASDDDLHLVPMSIDLYNKWLSAGLSAEMHIYSKGGHGFGMKKKGQPSDEWIERFGDWLRAQGLSK